MVFYAISTLSCKNRFFRSCFVTNADKLNLEARGRQTAIMQLIFSLSSEILTLSGEVEVLKQKLAPHFFAQILGKKT